MFVVDGVAYAGQPDRDMMVVEVKPIPDLCMLVTFSTGETRLFDATVLLKGPVFAPLLIEDIFSSPVVDGGSVPGTAGPSTWRRSSCTRTASRTRRQRLASRI